MQKISYIIKIIKINYDDNLKTTSVSFFIATFKLLSCEFDNFTLKLLY